MNLGVLCAACLLWYVPGVFRLQLVRHCSRSKSGSKVVISWTPSVGLVSASENDATPGEGGDAYLVQFQSSGPYM